MTENNVGIRGNGYFYVVKLIALLFKEGGNSERPFSIEVEKSSTAGVFDDIIYHLEDKNDRSHRLLQVKYKRNTKTAVSFAEFFSRDDPFSLIKYFLCYCSIKQSHDYGNVKEYILYSNANFERKELEEDEGIKVTNVKPRDIFLRDTYKFELTDELSNKLTDVIGIKALVKAICDYNVKEAARKEKEKFDENPREVTLRKYIFKAYNFPMIQEVIEIDGTQENVKDEKPATFSFKKAFQTGENISPEAKVLREELHLSLLLNAKLNLRGISKERIGDDIELLAGNLDECAAGATNLNLNELKKKFSVPFIEEIINVNEMKFQKNFLIGHENLGEMAKKCRRYLFTKGAIFTKKSMLNLMDNFQKRESLTQKADVFRQEWHMSLLSNAKLKFSKNKSSEDISLEALASWIDECAAGVVTSMNFEHLKKNFSFIEEIIDFKREKLQPGFIDGVKTLNPAARNLRNLLFTKCSVFSKKAFLNLIETFQKKESLSQKADDFKQELQLALLLNAKLKLIGTLKNDVDSVVPKVSEKNLEKLAYNLDKSTADEMTIDLDLIEKSFPPSLIEEIIDVEKKKLVEDFVNGVKTLSPNARTLRNHLLTKCCTIFSKKFSLPGNFGNAFQSNEKLEDKEIESMINALANDKISENKIELLTPMNKLFGHVICFDENSLLKFNDKFFGNEKYDREDLNTFKQSLMEQIDIGSLKTLRFQNIFFEKHWLTLPSESKIAEIIKSFCKDFVLALDQADDDEIDKALQTDFAKIFNLLDNNLIAKYLNSFIIQWVTEKTSRQLNQADFENFKTNIISDFLKYTIIGLKSEFCKSFMNFGIKYEENCSTQKRIKHFLQDDSKQMFQIFTESSILTSIKIHQATITVSCQDDEKKLLYKMDDSFIFLADNMIDEKVLKVYASERCNNLLIIVFDKLEQQKLDKFLNRVCKILIERKQKKLIMIIEESDEDQIQKINKTTTNILKNQMSTHLRAEESNIETTKETTLNISNEYIIDSKFYEFLQKKEPLFNKNITFNGNKCVLNDIISNEQFYQSIDGKTLLKLLTSKNIVVGNVPYTINTNEIHINRKIQMVKVDDIIFKESGEFENCYFCIEGNLEEIETFLKAKKVESNNIIRLSELILLSQKMDLDESKKIVKNAFFESNVGSKFIILDDTVANTPFYTLQYLQNLRYLSSNFYVFSNLIAVFQYIKIHVVSTGSGDNDYDSDDMNIDDIDDDDESGAEYDEYEYDSDDDDNDLETNDEEDDGQQSINNKYRNILIWICSIAAGEKNDFRNFVSKEKELVIDENYFLKYFEQNQCGVICDDAGAGKSTILNSFSQKCDKRSWQIRIDLNNYTDIFAAKMNEEAATNSTIFKFCDYGKNYAKLLLQTLLNKDFFVANMSYSDFFKIKDRGYLTLENFIFLDCFYNGKLLIKLDGFDEISPKYSDLILNFVKILTDETSNKVWITSRPNFQSKFRTFAYFLKPFSRKNQKQYLINFWTKNFKNGVDKPEKIEEHATWVMKHFKNLLPESCNKFMGIPLKMKMIAEIFMDGIDMRDEEKNDNISSKIPDLHTLYETFVNKKFERFFQRTAITSNSYYPKSFKIFSNYQQEIHEILAYKHLTKDYDEILSTHLSKIETPRETELYKEWMQDFHNKIENVGIIKNVSNDDNNPIFDHYTYAEYFCAHYLVKKLKSSPHLTKSIFVIVNQIFEKNVPVFINSFKHLLRYHIEFNPIENILGGMSPIVYATTCGLINCMKEFLKDRNFDQNFPTPDTNGKTLLHYAAEYGQINTVVFILMPAWSFVLQTESSVIFKQTLLV